MERDFPGETQRETIGRLSGEVDRLKAEVKLWKAKFHQAEAECVELALRARALTKRLRSQSAARSAVRQR